MSPSFALVLVLGADPVRIEHEVLEERSSWQPIEPSDVVKTIETTVLEAISEGGRFSLVAAPPCRTRPCAAEPIGDLRLLVRGRMVGEAETHLVVLEVAPGRRAEFPSFSASDTVRVGGKKRREMLTAIEDSARKAARALVTLVDRELARNGATRDPTPRSDPPAELAWRWPEVSIPPIGADRASKDLYAKDLSVAQAALRELTAAARVDAGPRRALERCLLGHPNAALRKGCLLALRPFARRLPATQRVIVEAFRKDSDGDVRSAASDEMAYFSGLSRAEAIAAWLESVSKCGATGPLGQLGELPNLELSLSQCLVSCGKRPKYQRSKRSCIELVTPLPVARKRRVLWPHILETDSESPYYLEGAGEREGSMGTDWQWAVEAALDGASELDSELEEALWRRYQRDLSSFALDVLGDFASPSSRLMTRLLEVVTTAGDAGALRALVRIGKSDPKLNTEIREKLAEALATSAFPKSLQRSSLEQSIRELEPKEAGR